MGRDRSVVTSHGFYRYVYGPIASHACLTDDIERIGCDGESFEFGGEHRTPAGLEVGQQFSHDSVCLEHAAKHVRENDGSDHQYEKQQRVAPAASPPYHPQNQQIERYPHRCARDGEHDAVDRRTAVEIECQKKVVIEIVHKIRILCCWKAIRILPSPVSIPNG